MQRQTNIRTFCVSVAVAISLSAGVVRAADTVELLDGDDVRLDDLHVIDRPLTPTFGAWPTLSASPIELSPTTARSAETRISIGEPQQTEYGVRLGMEIKLDDSDQIELKESDRLFVESEFGRTGNTLLSASDTGLGFSGSSLMTTGGFDQIGLLSRASHLGVDMTTFSLLAFDPDAIAPSFAGIRLGYANSNRLSLDPGDRGFSVAVTSMIMTNSPSSAEFGFLDVAALNSYDRSYNVGLNIGYRGFTFAASYLRGSQAFSSYESYDLGLSYDFGSWATTLSVGGYFADRGGLGLLTALDVDRLLSVEIGASYQIRPWFTVSGSLRLFDYSTLLGTGLDGLGGSLFLGTGLSF